MDSHAPVVQAPEGLGDLKLGLGPSSGLFGAYASSSSTGTRVLAARYNSATGWSGIGEVWSSTGSGAVAPLAVAESGGKLVVALRDGMNVRWRSWDGTTWDDAFAATSFYGPAAFHLDAAGTPHIARSEYDVVNESTRPAVLRWSGASWTDIAAGILAPFPEVTRVRPSVFAGADPGGALHLSWISDPPAGDVHLARWDGTTWSDIDAPIPRPAGQWIWAASFAFVGSELYVLGSTERLTAWRWNR